MAEEKPGLHIDLDWKKQAQEEKKRLEEEEKKRAEERAAASAAPATPAGVVPTAVAASGGAGAATPASSRRQARAAGTRGSRELPPASISSLSQSLVTQTLYYLSDQAARTGDEITNMDMAKHLIDTLGVLEDKTQGHLNEEEQQFLNTALYEARMRFIAVAGQVIAGG
jgi:hypothetical protein